MKKFKRLLMLLLALLCMASVACAESLADMRLNRPHEEIRPLYEYTASITAQLSFSNGKAVCSGSLKPNGNRDVTITVTLYKKEGSSWQYITSWPGSATGGLTAAAGGSVSVDRGTYKVVTSGNVGGLEYPTKSTQKTY